MGDVFGIDYAWGRPSTTALHDAGVKFVCRYLSHSDSKNLHPDEARHLSDAGIWLVVVWETTATRAEDGHDAGVQDARDALAEAEACGMPAGRPIYFAIDEQTSVGPHITGYFQGVNSVLGVERTGAYGDETVLRQLFDAHLIAWGWQTYAWSGGKWEPRAHLEQYSNGHTLDGVDVDYDRAIAADYGQWRIGASPTPNPPSQEADMPDYMSVQRYEPEGGTGGTFTIHFDKTNEDTKKLRDPNKPTPGILNGGTHGAFFTATVDVEGTGRARLVEVNPDDSWHVTKAYSWHPAGEAFTESGCVSPNQHLWVQAEATAPITAAAKVVYWAR